MYVNVYVCPYTKIHILANKHLIVNILFVRFPYQHEYQTGFLLIVLYSHTQKFGQMTCFVDFLTK